LQHCIIIFLKPIADEQVRAKPYAFPADEHDHIVGAHYQQQHGENEEIQDKKNILQNLYSLFMHIRSGIYMDQKPTPVMINKNKEES
jgi:hypothetical protein